MEETKRPKIRYREADKINESDYFRWLKTYLDERPPESKLKVLWYVCCPESRKQVVDEDLIETLKEYGDRIEVVEKYFDDGNALSDEFDERANFREMRLRSIKEEIPILVFCVARFVRSELCSAENLFERLTVRDMKNIADCIKGLTLLTFMKPNSSGGASASKVKTTLSDKDMETRRWVALHKAGMSWAEIVDLEKIPGDRVSARDRIRKRVKDHIDDFDY